MKKTFWILILFFCLIPFYKTSAQSSNAGFVPGNIWYSKDPFEEGDKIKIYTVLFNPDTREFSGTVIFFDKTIFLGKKDFIVAPRAVKDVSIDWAVAVGDHNIFAKIENAKFLVSPGKYEEVYLSGNQTEESKRTVSKKIAVNTEKVAEALLDKSSQSIENLGKTIEEKTPSLISRPVVASAETIESFRENIRETSQENKETIKLELAKKKEGTEKEGKLTTPFRYVKLFFWSLISFLFNNKIIFYGVSATVIFFALRYFWRLVF